MAELLLNDLPRGAVLLADRAHDADWIRVVIADPECKACIPPKVYRTGPAPYSKRVYKKRNLIERCIGKLKRFRHVCTRCDRGPSNCLAMAKLAAVRLWPRNQGSAAEAICHAQRQVASLDVIAGAGALRGAERSLVAIPHCSRGGGLYRGRMIGVTRFCRFIRGMSDYKETGIKLDSATVPK